MSESLTVREADVTSPLSGHSTFKWLIPCNRPICTQAHAHLIGGGVNLTNDSGNALYPYIWEKVDNGDSKVCSLEPAAVIRISGEERHSILLSTSGG